MPSNCLFSTATSLLQVLLTVLIFNNRVLSIYKTGLDNIFINKKETQIKCQRKCQIIQYSGWNSIFTAATKTGIYSFCFIPDAYSFSKHVRVKHFTHVVMDPLKNETSTRIFAQTEHDKFDFLISQNLLLYYTYIKINIYDVALILSFFLQRANK